MNYNGARDSSVSEAEEYARGNRWKKNATPVPFNRGRTARIGGVVDLVPDLLYSPVPANEKVKAIPYRVTASLLFITAKKRRGEHFSPADRLRAFQLSGKLPRTGSSFCQSDA